MLDCPAHPDALCPSRFPVPTVQGLMAVAAQQSAFVQFGPHQISIPAGDCGGWGQFLFIGIHMMKRQPAIELGIATPLTTSTSKGNRLRLQPRVSLSHIVCYAISVFLSPPLIDAVNSLLVLLIVPSVLLPNLFLVLDAIFLAALLTPGFQPESLLPAFVEAIQMLVIAPPPLGAVRG